MILEKKFEYLPKREVERTLEKILQFFSSNLSKGNRIEIRDFGTFKTRLRKSRTGRNPSTGEEIKINEKFFIKNMSNYAENFLIPSSQNHNFSNNHLQYAITWFLMSFSFLIIFIIYLFRKKK